MCAQHEQHADTPRAGAGCIPQGSWPSGPVRSELFCAIIISLMTPHEKPSLDMRGHGGGSDQSNKKSGPDSALHAAAGFCERGETSQNMLEGRALRCEATSGLASVSRGWPPSASLETDMCHIRPQRTNSAWDTCVRWTSGWEAVEILLNIWLICGLSGSGCNRGGAKVSFTNYLAFFFF